MAIDIIAAKTLPYGLEWVQNIYPLYLHDLSQFDSSYYQLDEHGRWEPDQLTVWFSNPNAQPLIIRSRGQNVGLAFVGCAPFHWVNPGIDFRMAEFFILRRFRREGIGRQAARQIFDLYPGKWEVIELPTNNPAVLFWRAVISEYTDGNFEQDSQNGMPRQIFQSPGPTASILHHANA